MSEVGVKIKAEMKINGVRIHASPQPDLKSDICNEVGSNSTYIGAINKIVLVDSSGSERDSTTSLSVSYPASNQVQFTCSISITASYTVSYVRAYSGTKKYFETSWTKGVSSGDAVNITLTVTINASGSLSGSTTGSISAGTFEIQIANALGGGTRVQIGLATAKLYTADGGLLGTFTFVRSIDLANYRVTGDTGVVSPSNIGNASYVGFLNSAGNALIAFYFDKEISISTNTRVKITYTFSVS